MWQIKTTKQTYYEIITCSDVFDPQNKHLLFNGEALQGEKRFVVVDSVVLELYGEEIINYFKKNNIVAKIIPYISGEVNKTFASYIAILEELNNFPINRRNEPIIAIGGGVLIDVVGFVASTYRRGIPYIKVPTTLMGYVDVSTAAKTGINFGQYKNRVGSFFPPLKVILDSRFFLTQNTRHILNGVGEIIKLAVIKDKAIFDLLESNGRNSIKCKFQDDVSKLILSKSITDMKEELENNLFEDALARVVDFGHTFSTVLEMQKELDLLHGEAVVTDIVLSSILSHIRGTLDFKDLQRILKLIMDLQSLTCTPKLTADDLWGSIKERTCHRNGLQQIPLPCGIGRHVFANDVTYEQVQSTCEFFINNFSNKNDS